MNSERKAFEEWCVENDEFCIHRHTDYCQEYSDDYTQSAWEAWQASIQRQGYNLVPVDDLKHIRALNKDAREADEKYLKEINNTLGRIVNELIEGNNE